MLRLLVSIFANGLTSVTSLVLSVIVARTGGTSSLGDFAVAYAAYLLIQLVAREAGITPLLGLHTEVGIIRSQCRRQSLIGIVGTVAMVAIGFIIWSPSLIVIGFSLHGMVVLNYSKVLSLTLSDGKQALFQDSVVLVSVLCVAISAAYFDVNYILVISVWAVGSSVLGYCAAVFQGFGLRPSWLGRGEESKVGLLFAVQSLVGAGSINFLTFILAAVSGPFLVGTLKGGSTLLGPANVVTTAVQPLAIRSLSTVRSSSRALRFRKMARLAAGLSLLYSAVAIPSFFGAQYFGEYLLGATWIDVQPIFIIMSIDGLLAAVIAIPSATHRALWASTVALRVSLCLLVVRFPAVILGAVLGGVEGAAWGYMFSSVISVVVWWISALLISPRDMDS